MFTTWPSFSAQNARWQHDVGGFGPGGLIRGLNDGKSGRGQVAVTRCWQVVAGQQEERIALHRFFAEP